MAVSRTIRITVVVLVALAIVEAGALAYVVSDRSSMSNELRAEEQRSLMSSALVDISSELQLELATLDKATMEGAFDLFGQELNGSLAHNVLNDILNASAHTINVLTVDRNGTIVAIEPAQYEWMVGLNLSGDDPLIELLEHGRPLISTLFETLEGFEAITIADSVLDPQGRIVGAISTLVRPDHMMENISAALSAKGLSAMVMQEDGVVIYDPDASQVGKNTFTDPLFQNFTEIRSVAYRMVNESSGSGNYSFQAGSVEVRKTVMWTSVAVLGMRWTVAVNKMV